MKRTLWKKTIDKIQFNIKNVPDIQKDEWIAVNMGSIWYPAQFEMYDAEQEEIQAFFLHRSSSNLKWFIFPQFQINGKEDKSWVSEDKVFYRLSVPKEGKRQTLLFDEVARLFNEIKKL